MSIQGDKLKAIADAIRAKKGTTEPIIADNFASEIASIETGGGATEGNLFADFISGNITEVTASQLQGITKVREYAFYQYKNLKSVQLPETVNAIGQSCFNSSKQLVSVNIPEGVSILQPQTFYYCSALVDITFPSTITTIKDSVVQNCTNLKTVTVLAQTPPTLYRTATFPTSVTTIYIPAGTLTAYQSATNWSAYASKFVELPA